MYVQVKTKAGAAWVFEPDVVPPSISEIEHEEEAARRADDADKDEWMNELDTARAIAEGRLSGPQEYENMWLFPLRITGTGASYRPEYNEHVWRDPTLYLNGEFLNRCNGLPVIWEHPPGDQLDQKEWEKRVIGSIMLAYIVKDEVWGVARVYDQDAARIMLENQLSTSPAVVFRPGTNQSRKLEGGKTQLIEGEPALLDHLAVCELGVWDKAGEPTGVTLGGPPQQAERMVDPLPPEVTRVDRLGSMLDALSTLVTRI